MHSPEIKYLVFVAISLGAGALLLCWLDHLLTPRGKN
jgi:hypothetical protein